MPTVASLRDPHFQYYPARLPKVPEDINAMVKGEVRRNCPSFGLEHGRRISRGDPPQQFKLLVGERAAGRVIPELQALAMDFADDDRTLETCYQQADVDTVRAVVNCPTKLMSKKFGAAG